MALPARGWNFAEVWETVADCLPEQPAVIQGGRRVSWRDFASRADSLASSLLQLGLQHQQKVALFLFNCPEYLESTFALHKAALVPVNTNFRYAGDELTYLWTDCDAAAVVFHSSLTAAVDSIRTRVPQVRLWLCVADDATACPPWAVSYESLTTTASSGHTRGPRGVSPDDQILLYTGGTTGMPKGVIWRQDDVFRFLNEASPEPYPDDGSLADVRAALVRRGGGGIQLSPSPLMHATGGWSACGALSRGGTSVLLAARRFDPVELLDTVDREQVTAMLLVGDAFAQPIAAALAATPARWNLQSLRVLASTGAALGATTRRLLIDLLPTTTQVMEGISSSEAVAIAGTKVTGDAEQVGHFRPAAGVRVIADDGRDVAAGSGEAGQIAVCRFVPLGYYKDPQRTARTIRVIDGRRYVLPGDYATVDADGSIRFIGRGTGCINSGGEKIFPQEVENVLLRHPSILEVAILGAPDERMGEAVTAVLRLRDGCHATDDELIAHVRSMLAHYKAPKRFLRLQELPRQPNGKPDYLRLRQYVLQQIQSSRSP